MATKNSKAKTPVASKPPTQKGSAGRTSLASLFDDADASEATNSLSAGEKQVRLNSFEIKENPKGAGAFVEYEAIDGDEEGKKCRQMYKLTDPDGNAAPGMNYLKRDLALLGYEEVSGKQLKKILAELSEAQPMVVINVKENGNYVNAYLQGLAEDIDVDEDEDDADEEEEESAEIEVGSRVKFTDDDEDETLEGEVTAIKGDKVTVKVGKKLHKLTADDVTLVEEDTEEEEEEEEEESAEIEVGSRVKFTNDDEDEVEGKVVKINTKTNQATVKDDDDDKHVVDVDDLELVEDDE